jgi:hypothetical protein
MNALKRLIGRSGVAARALEDDNVPLKDLLAADVRDTARSGTPSAVVSV